MEAEPSAIPRARILIAAGAAVVLAAIIAVVAVASGGDSDERATVAAPARCIEAWNADQAARAYGRHNFSFHLYEGALVTFLSKTGEEVGEGEGGLCAVIFPSQALDPEPFAAGQVLKGRLLAPDQRAPGNRARPAGRAAGDRRRVAEHDARRPGRAGGALISRLRSTGVG